MTQNLGREYYRQKAKEYKAALKPRMWYSDPNKKPLEYRQKALAEMQTLSDEILTTIQDTNPTNRLRVYAKRELRRRKKLKKLEQLCQK